MKKYFPRIIGLTPQGVIPDGGLFEVLVVGADELGALWKLTTTLAKHSVNIDPSGGYHLLKPGTFIWTTFADFSKAKSSPDEVMGDLKQLSFVKQADVVKLGETAFDQFLFPVVQMGKFRGAIFGVEPLLGVERRLIEQFGPPGGVILFEEGRQYLVESVGQLEEFIAEERPEALLANVIAWLRTTGWGIFEFDATRLQETGEITVRIDEPPMAVTPGLSRSNFLNGVAAGVIDTVYKRKMRIKSDNYDPTERRLTLVFKDTKH